MNIVMDKSYLQGKNKDQIRTLARGNQYFITRSFLYEVIKECPSNRAKLFKKFNEEKPYILLPTFSDLFQYEMKNGKPCGLPSTYVVQRDYGFHSNLCNEDYHLTDEKLMVLKGENIFLNRTLILFELIIENNMELKNTITREDLDDKIINDDSFIQRQYDSLILSKCMFGHSVKPKKEQLNSGWFTFRWLQLMNLFTVDLAYRYASMDVINGSKKVKEKIRHDILDLEYLLFGIAEGAFATKEKKLIKWFSSLSKDGTCIDD